VATGVTMVHWSGIGVQLEQSWLCWSGMGSVRVAPGVNGGAKLVSRHMESLLLRSVVI
jgi:hypothetical protein